VAKAKARKGKAPFGGKRAAPFGAAPKKSGGKKGRAMPAGRMGRGATAAPKRGRKVAPAKRGQRQGGYNSMAR